MEAVERLLGARLALEKAVAEFFDACAVLKTVALSPLVTFPKQITSENVVQRVLASIDAIGLVEDRMKGSRAALNTLLNVSPSRVPINQLPPEILGRVFSFVAATSPCCLDGVDTLTKLPLVCVKWNQVAISTRSLWTHIDIGFASSLSVTTLGRARKLLDRCRNMPVHIHFDGDNEAKPADVPDIVATLQPHVGFLSSLYITKTRLHSLICGLLGLVSGPGAANSLKRLSLYNLDDLDSQEGLRTLPVTMLQGLTQLELTDLDELACPSMGDTARVLSGCLALHTLRLRRLETPSDRSHDHTTVSLPHLRFLEITEVGPRSEVLAFLSKTIPGALELDVRLDADYTVERDGLALPAQLFLARANVVSLSINFNLSSVSGERLESLFACVPRLRVLRLNGRVLAEVARILGTEATNTSSLPIAHLQSLCLGHSKICPETANRLKQIIERRGLYNLVFLACTYSPSLSLPKNPQQTKGPRLNIGRSEKYGPEMPESTKEWFSERVERVIVVRESRNAKVYHGIDPFVQGLMKPN
ncbi:hypothetical protein FRC12_018970 [Ceratobasidium sp. 428]|nr:hypothetical protein FRC12_018970 [Ceratobasidium sp. 428]